MIGELALRERSAAERAIGFHVLIVDDETGLRTALAEGLAAVDGVRVTDVPSVDAAVEVLDRDAPQLVITDVNLPGRIGLDLIHEIGARGRPIPVVAMTAYRSMFEDAISSHRGLTVLEKPLSIASLREVVERHRRAGPGDGSPFELSDYLQLANLGRHDLVLDVELPSGARGHVAVVAGEVWHASLADGVFEVEGEAALGAMLAGPSACSFRRSTERPERRTLHQPLQGLLLELAYRHDESLRPDLEPELDDLPALRNAARELLLSNEDLLLCVVSRPEAAGFTRVVAVGVDGEPDGADVEALESIVAALWGGASRSLLAAPREAQVADDAWTLFSLRLADRPEIVSVLGRAGLKRGVGWMLLRDAAPAIEEALAAAPP